MAKNKRLTAGQASVDRNKAYGLDEAIGLVKQTATAKFDETIEISLNLGIDPRHADQMVRGLLSLPNGTGGQGLLGLRATGEHAH
ncbi:MAG: 50S ribosomal protein L1, partial [Gluconacetobacter sp.]